MVSEGIYVTEVMGSVSFDSLSGSQAKGWVCFQVVRLHSSRPFSFGNFLSLILFDLLPLLSIRLYYILLLRIPISYLVK